MKRLLNFIRSYRLFCLALVTLIICLILQVTNQASIARWILAIVAIFEALPLIWSMWRDIQVGSYGIDILAASAIIVSVLLKQDWAALVIVLMLTGGESLEDFAQHRARRELDTLLKHAPQKAQLIRKGKILEVKASDLRPGDRIIIKAGELVPVDALIIEGGANFDESSLTGESLPQFRQAGEQLLSGSINQDGAVRAQATVSAEDSQYQQIISLVRGAAASQTPFIRLADRYSLPFTVLAYGIAVAAWVLSGQSIRFLDVIVVATPCPLLLAAPIALISGMSRASRYGIIVKTGSALEKLAEARTIAFDKTGTLTYGHQKVDKVIASDAYNENDVLKLAASLEKASNHVMAKAIVDAAAQQKLKTIKLKNVRESRGLGLEAVVKGKLVLVGRLTYLEEAGIKVPAKYTTNADGRSCVYVGSGSDFVGAIYLKDQIREEAASTLDSLRNMGIKNIAMITGDNLTTANKVAASLKINKVHAEMLPADKIHTIEKYDKRPLAFVGDGINDTPALAAADIGIALGARGSTAASESADMVIMQDDLGHVAAAVSIAKQTFKIARQSILIGIGLSIFLMIIFASGSFTPLEGAIVQEIVDVFVIFNALRARLISVDI